MEILKTEMYTNNNLNLVEVKNEIEIDEGDDRNWKMWCRLCAKDGHDNICIYDDTQSSDMHPDINLAIEKHFSSYIRIKEQDLPNTLCTECYYFLKKLLDFEKRVDETQELFASMIANKHIKASSKFEMVNEFNINPQIFQQLPERTCVEMCETNLERNPLDIVDNEAEKDSSETKVPSNNFDEDATKFEENDSEQTISVSNQSDSEQSQYNLSSYTKVKSKFRKKFECNECSRKFSHSSDYKLHLKHVHKVNIKLVEHKCDQCSKVFNRKAEYNKHLKSHLNKDIQNFVKCPQCDVRVTSHALKKHINSIHVKGRPFLCDECGRAFRTLANLNEHKLTHTDYAPYVCNCCGKGFKAEKWLKKHMDMHDPNGHICKICNAHLKSNLTLKRHMVIHSNEKPFKCDFCDYSCKRAKNLKVHLISHAGLKPYACDICYQSFSSGANCLKHKKKLHPEELAAQEQMGVQQYTKNVPNLAFLKALTQSSIDLKPIISRRSVLNNIAKKS